MRFLADLHIAPRTVQFLRQLGHDVARVSDLAPQFSMESSSLLRMPASESGICRFISKLLTKSAGGILDTREAWAERKVSATIVP